MQGVYSNSFSECLLCAWLGAEDRAHWLVQRACEQGWRGAPGSPGQTWEAWASDGAFPAGLKEQEWAGNMQGEVIPGGNSMGRVLETRGEQRHWGMLGVRGCGVGVASKEGVRVHGGRRKGPQGQDHSIQGRWGGCPEPPRNRQSQRQAHAHRHTDTCAYPDMECWAMPSLLDTLTGVSA